MKSRQPCEGIMRPMYRAQLIGVLLICSAPAVSLAQDAVVDDYAPGNGADIAPTLKLRTKTDPSSRRDIGVYNENEVWQKLGQEPPPSELMRRQALLEKDRREGDAVASLHAGPSKSASKPNSESIDGGIDPDAKQLEELTVFGHGDESWYGDLRLSRIERQLPCLGCGRAPQSISKAARIGGDVILSLLRGFFAQPHVRGEPNDEAAYQINFGCGQDNLFRCQLP